MKLLVATRNRGKTAEMEHLLDGTGWRVVDMSAIGQDIEIVEDGKTFEENARKKAEAAAKVWKMWTLADDSGLEIDALGGEPGIHSARLCGPNATDNDRTRMILDKIIAVPDEHRTARFCCVMCLIDPAGHKRIFEGVCHGRIAHHARGTTGFGYDPVFVPKGYSRTFAELGLEVKNRFSHRAKAMQQVVEYLKTRVRKPDKHR